MVKAAVMCVLAYWLIQAIDGLLSWQTFSRPIVAAPITGLLIGDLHTGIVMGGSLEAIFMGISAIGGSVAADALTSSIISVAYTVLTKSDIETGLAIAMPIGTLMSSFNSLLSPFFAALSPYWEELAAKGDIKKFRIQTILFQLFIQRIAGAVVLFLAVAYGTAALESVWSSLPGFVTRGLGAASSMMTGVGYAILLSMLWSNEVGIYFFLGYVLSKYLKMDSLSIALIGATFAFTIFFIEQKINDVKNSVSAKSTANNEEDFF